MAASFDARSPAMALADGDALAFFSKSSSYYKRVEAIMRVYNSDWFALAASRHPLELPKTPEAAALIPKRDFEKEMGLWRHAVRRLAVMPGPATSGGAR